MARIIYALSGQGRGHTSRGMAVAEGLRGRGHRVRFCGGGAAQKILQAQGENVIPVRQLQTVLRNNTIQARATLLANWPSIRNLDQIVRKLADQISEWKADLVITDFEAFSWRAANLLDLPVISLNHQQIVTETCYALPTRHKYHANLARIVINIVAPRTPNRLLLSSFFYPEVKRPDITTIVPPIIRSEIVQIEPTEGEHILVYYNQPEGNQALLEHLRADGRRYIVYNFPKPENTSSYPNITFKPACVEEFLEDLADCRGVLCTAGFTLLSESLYLGKPLMVVPNRGIFEQTLNAIFLEREALGKAVIGRNISADDLTQFHAYIDSKANMNRSWNVRGNSEAIDLIEEELHLSATSWPHLRPESQTVDT